MKIFQRAISLLIVLAIPVVSLCQTTSVIEQQDYIFAVGLYRDGQYGLALRQFKTFLENYPNTEHFDEITFLSGECWFQEKMFDSALSDYQRILTGYRNSSYFGRSELRTGEVWLELGKLDVAEKNLKEVLSENSVELGGEAAYDLGRLFTEKPDLSNALKYFQLSCEGYKNSGVADFALYGEAWCFGKLGEFGKSKEKFSELISGYPETKLKADAIEKIGECDFFLGNFRPAIEEFDRASSSSPETQVLEAALYYRGRALQSIGRNDSAILGYYSYLTSFPEAAHSSEVRLLLSGLLMTIPGRVGEAVSVLKGMPSSDSLYFESRLELARVYERLNLPDTSETILLSMAGSARTHMAAGEADFELGKLYFDQKRYSKSVEYFVLASKDTVLYGESMKDAATAAASEGDYEVAEGYFIDSIHYLQGMELLEAHFDYAAALYAGGDFRRAKEIYLAAEKISVSDTDRSEALYMAGESAYRAGDYLSALSFYENYSQAYPTGDHAATALEGEGYSNYYLDRFANAAIAFQKFIDRYPDSALSADANVRLGDCYYYNKDYRRALGVYADVISKFGSHSAGQRDTLVIYALYQSGESEYWLGRNEESVQTFSSVLSKYPNAALAPDAQYAIGWVYFSQKQYSKAIAAFDKVISDYSASPAAVRALYSNGDSYYNSGDYNKALICYSEILSKFPASGFVNGAIVGMQYCLTVLGRPLDAENVIDNFVRDHPTSPNVDKVYYKKIEYSLNQKEYLQAAQELKTFLKKFPESSLSGNALYDLGLVEIALGETKKAIDVLSGLVAKKPGDEYSTAGKVKLAELYAPTANGSEAERLLTEASSEGNRYGIVAQLELAKYYLARGDTSKAETLLSRISESDTSGSEAAANAKLILTGVYYLKGRVSDAIALSGTVARSREDLIGAEAQLKVAEYYCDDGDTANAKLAFLRVKYVFASFSDIVARSQLEYADCLSKFGNQREAKALLQDFIKNRPDDSFAKSAKDKLKEIKSN